MVQAACQAKHLGDHLEAVRIEAVAVNELGDGDVAFGGQGREEIETLENETDFVAAQLGARRVAQCREIVAVNQDFAARGLRQSADQVQERRLAASRRPHHSNGFPGQHLEIHATQGRHFHLARAVQLP